MSKATDQISNFDDYILCLLRELPRVSGLPPGWNGVVDKKYREKSGAEFIFYVCRLLGGRSGARGDVPHVHAVRSE